MRNIEYREGSDLKLDVGLLLLGSDPTSTFT